MIKQFLDRLRAWAKRLKTDIYALYIAIRDARTPPYARWCAIIVVAYALSPIDLIPDFIPVLGLLDDLILLPLGIAFLKKLIPPVVLAQSQHRAQSLMRSGLPASRNAAMIIVAIWALVLTTVILWLINRVTNQAVPNNPPSISSEAADTRPDVPRSNSTIDANRSRSRERE